MNLKIWFYKHFKKESLIRVIYFDESKHVSIKYTIPKGKRFDLNKETYEINQDDFFLMGGIPTYIHRAGKIEPVNPFNTKKSPMAPDYYNVAITSELAKDAFKKADDDKEDDKKVLAIALGLGILIIGLIAFTYMQFESVFELLEPLTQTEPGGGGANG